jgi:multimeric flavodoxin WrbA
MKVIAIYGNPKAGGFVHGCLDAICDRLEIRGTDLERLHLREQGIQDCTGCFACLRTGECVLPDAMNEICRRMRAADGFVVGCSVRNGYVTALYKRFFERITYPLGFTGDLAGKYVLSVSAVGKATGKRATGRLLGLQGEGAYRTGHLFFHTGIPTTRTVDDCRGALEAGADRFLRRFEKRWRPGPLFHIGRRFDRFLIRKLMLNKDPDTYAHVIDCWKRRGWMK